MMLLTMKERIFATTMDEQRTRFLCGRVSPMIAWPFAADESKYKEQLSFKGDAPAMRLLSRPILSLFLRISVQLQKRCRSCDIEKGKTTSSIWQK